MTEETEQNLWQKITGAVSGALDYVGKAVDIAKKVLGNFVEAATVLLVTSCIIPIVVLVAYIMIIKYVFGLDFSILNLPDRVLPSRRLKRIVGNDEYTGEKKIKKLVLIKLADLYGTTTDYLLGRTDDPRPM